MADIRNLPVGYDTKLALIDELAFRNWIAQNKVPFNPDRPVTDYDMRGFWQAANQQRPGVSAQVNPNDNKMHYSDTFKTPMHESFSRESQWAGPDAARWVQDSRLVDPQGNVVFDEKGNNIPGTTLPTPINPKDYPGLEEFISPGQ
jgi:hypothetical protein